MKNEGFRSLYLGLTPALTRSVLYGGLRLGLYEPTKVSFDWAFGSTNVLVKIASGAFAGAFSTALTNPVEVVKVDESLSNFLILFIRSLSWFLRHLSICLSLGKVADESKRSSNCRSAGNSL